MFSVTSLLKLRMKRLWLPGFSLGLILLPGLAFAETQPARIFPRAKRIALPELSDGLGWKQPRYYSTIQTADIDGDGQSEVLARWIDGLTVYRFENGTLIRHSRISALSDNAGFYQPSWYSTIHPAVLDRKLGRADIVAREHDGIHVFRYNAKKREWRELGAHASVRPFPDMDADGTDWTKPSHYLTIQLGDLTGDGVAELVGRGHNGMQVWRWDSAGESWTQLTGGGELTDGQGFDQEAYYYSIQLIDVDHDGIAELIARAPGGMQTYKWSNGAWTMVGANGPFGDGTGLLAGKRYTSVRASVDADGQAWLYGIAAGNAGAGSGAIQVHRWTEGDWEQVQTLPLPGSGWDRESQASTLMAADIQGDAKPEFLVRGPRGLLAYTLEGRQLPMQSQSFTDAQGWNLTEEYGTMRPATAVLKENGTSHGRTLILGRGSKGLEVYKFTGKWADAADSNFPQYCAGPHDTSAPCVAYQTLSGKLIAGHVDIRSQYTTNALNAGFWLELQTNLNNMSNPIGPANGAVWQTVKSEMVSELGYVYTVAAWFTNNNAVLKFSYGKAAGDLDSAASDVTLDDGTSVAAQWLEFTGDIVAGIGGFFEGGPAISLVITVLKDTYSELAESNGDVNEAIAEMRTDLINQDDAYITTSATEETSYLTNYSKLQQIGLNAATGGYDWAKAKEQAVADAQVGAEKGMRINFYRTLIPYRWQVYWCYDQTDPSCGSVYTEDKYDCHFGDLTPLGKYNSEAYIYAGAFDKVNWSLLDTLTGTGTDDLNAIWYMMMLGGDLGWNLPQYGTPNNGPYVKYADPNLSYNEIEYGYLHPMNSACNGNGSTTGIQSANQTLSQRLMIAQQNTRHITGTEAKSILEDIRTLKQDTANASSDRDIQIDLSSPLQETAKLIERANLQTSSSQQGSVSATTPTHLLELFIRRTQLHTSELGQRQAEYLTAKAYSVVAALEGQN